MKGEEKKKQEGKETLNKLESRDIPQEIYDFIRNGSKTMNSEIKFFFSLTW